MTLERAESGQFQVVGEDACALRERAEKYTFRSAIGKAVDTWKFALVENRLLSGLDKNILF